MFIDGGVMDILIKRYLVTFLDGGQDLVSGFMAYFMDCCSSELCIASSQEANKPFLIHFRRSVVVPNSIFFCLRVLSRMNADSSSISV